jgi:hypothetical protein
MAKADTITDAPQRDPQRDSSWAAHKASRPASARRFGKEGTDEELAKPALILLSGPSSQANEVVVGARVGDRPKDVRGSALGQARPECTAASQSSSESALVPVSKLLLAVVHGCDLDV